jgi:hypothetical protein
MRNVHFKVLYSSHFFYSLTIKINNQSYKFYRKNISFIFPLYYHSHINWLLFSYWRNFKFSEVTSFYCSQFLSMFQNTNWIRSKRSSKFWITKLIDYHILKTLFSFDFLILTLLFKNIETKSKFFVWQQILFLFNTIQDF